MESGQRRHQKSWELVKEFVNGNFQVWSIKLEQSIVPTLLPWVDEQMERCTFSRSQTEECNILYVCLPTMGVVSSMKLQFTLQLITSFLAARSSNSIAVVIHANRAAEPKKRRGINCCCGNLDGC